MTFFLTLNNQTTLHIMIIKKILYEVVTVFAVDVFLRYRCCIIDREKLKKLLNAKKNLVLKEKNKIINNTLCSRG